MSAPHVVILGGGIAGMLAAAATSRIAGAITIIERDRLPAVPAGRRGVPQGRHLHGLLSTGVSAIESLLPGTTATMRDHGAQQVRLSEEALIYGPHGWMRPVATPHFIVGASRPLVEWAIRHQLTAQHRCTIVQDAEAVGLHRAGGRVGGVRIRYRGTGQVEEVSADLIIDATGRGSQTPRWLAEFGVGPVADTVVDCGLAYASRLVRTAPGARSYACVTVQADARNHVPGRGGFWLQVENDQTMVTLSGTRGAHPPLDEPGFTEFALGLRHPLIGHLLADSTPLGPIKGSQTTANRRRHYDRIRKWPAGFLVIGDAATTFNPIYGQGMSVAALGALNLRRGLHDNRLDGAGCRRLQQTICRTADLPWTVCVTEDIRYPGARGRTPSHGQRLTQLCADRLRATSAADPAAAQAFFDVLSLSAPPIRALTPAAAWAVLRGPRQPPVWEPPNALYREIGA
ncbi:FAD-dependent oxidoreductase [Nocardia brasiliensis]|uniref:FAD-dependent oxidoreductase n=1 Tax=Nocardia brasiliensis TaxID=37326 RepID=UPI001892EE47|nr:tryptophan 7-halogenase [Nocardia brasiliensis]MBF6543626.1 tryptophan 7-halogenase [Nocardia brasiliensis]